LRAVEDHPYILGNCVIPGKTTGTSDCVKNVVLSEAKDLKWPKNEILRYTQNLHMLPMPR